MTNNTSTVNQKHGPNWTAILGWAVAILCIAGIFWMQKQKNELEETIQTVNTENVVLKSEKNTAESQLASNSEMLNILRSKDFQTFTLIGNQAVAPQAFSKIYWNKKEKLAYVDVFGLPAPPLDKVYQVWSLKKDSFLPTNAGLIPEVDKAKSELYQLDNFPEPEILCITLENKGGSKSPSMSQIYVMDPM
ncbi:anti-sigma factor [Aequorivita sp. H23M31]|uniref:Anti-sigma factor n=1 Tax=Aequorivita ciconiae TaxID=2494375 RepID=A0A410G6M9_9FLAO|nr:anti-sigma factor [Aequorivita sp. H23M31]QAA82959.1 anti-sigma factor [Aequorivita sp. H23M31]